MELEQIVRVNDLHCPRGGLIYNGLRATVSGVGSRWFGLLWPDYLQQQPVAELV